MMSFKNIFCVVLVPLLFSLLAGCARYSNVSPGEASRWKKNESIIVMGIPDTHRIIISRGKNSGSKWKASGRNEVIRDYRWTDNYLIRKVKSSPADEGLGVTRILVQKDELVEFRPCKGNETLVFKVPPNQVLYIGHVELKSQLPQDGNYQQDIELARSYLADKYPELAPQLIMAETEVRELANISCNFLLVDFLNGWSAF